ncbi:MAG: hypothetical protein H8D35_05575 [Nitrosopumilus sp.]|nr:hypothetical protein [Nitrosopumilus sp.]MBL7015218.1 hypothetical protein [Nitrosopumilus sp.]
MSIKINCTPCRNDNHDECTHDNCLCEIDCKHNAPSLKDGVQLKEEDRIVDRDVWKQIYADQRQARLDFEGKNKIDNVCDELQRLHSFITLRKTDEILLYNGKIYDKDKAETVIKEETEKLIPNCTTHNRSEVINKIRAQTYSDLENFDADPNIITLENGILSLDSLELLPHTPRNLSRVLYPVEYIPLECDDVEDNLKDTLFWKFLTTSFTVDNKFRKEDFETVLEIMASVFVKKQIDEKASMFLGQGENGKSVLLQYLSSMLGKNNLSSMSLQEMSDDKFMIAELDGKSANIYPDLERNELKRTGRIKAITSNEPIQAQKKHGHPFTLYPFCKLIFSCNRFPKVSDQGQGFFRRWLIVKWERNFENDSERDSHLLEKLLSNRPETNLVFSCLVDIANKLNKMGKFTHSKDWIAIQKEWNENADPLDDFVNNYIIDSDSNKSKRETYQFYKKIMLSKGENPLGIGTFSKAFAEYFDADRNNHTREWLNIDFKTPVVSKLEDFSQ